MKTITKKQWQAIHKAYRGIWTNPAEPQYIGKRTMLDNDPKHGTVLLIEDYSFKIKG